MTKKKKQHHRVILGASQKAYESKNMPDNIRKRIIASQPTSEELATDKWSSEPIHND